MLADNLMSYLDVTPGDLLFAAKLFFLISQTNAEAQGGALSLVPF